MYEFKPELGSNWNQMGTIDGYVTIANGGAVGTTYLRGASVAKTTTGTYTITMENAYQALYPTLMYQCKATGTNLRTELGDYSASGKSVVFRIINSSGTATDPTTGCAVVVKIRVRKSATT
jgi:hypothetical protein